MSPAHTPLATLASLASVSTRAAVREVAGGVHLAAGRRVAVTVREAAGEASDCALAVRVTGCGGLGAREAALARTDDAAPTGGVSFDGHRFPWLDERQRPIRAAPRSQQGHKQEASHADPHSLDGEDTTDMGVGAAHIQPWKIAANSACHAAGREAATGAPPTTPRVNHSIERTRP